MDPTGTSRGLHGSADRRHDPGAWLTSKRSISMAMVIWTSSSPVSASLFPDNRRIGSVVILENDGHQNFTPHVVAQGIARVADVRAGDLDGDGDLDLAVAGFGYDDGETTWLENEGGWRFTPHVIQRLSGAINALIVDLNGDGRLDIVTLVSQEWEEVWAFINDGNGQFTPKLLWGSTNADFGSSWISVVDLDRDGDPDILYSNGDAFDYAPANSRPWHGVQWLENRGQLKFDMHRIADLSGASSVQAADLDGDGDLDVAVVSAYNKWDDPSAQSLVWLENNGHQQFTMHEIASVADAPDYAGGRRSRRRRQDRSRHRRHAHQPAVRSHVAGDALEQSWLAVAAVTRRSRHAISRGIRRYPDVPAAAAPRLGSCRCCASPRRAVFVPGRVASEAVSARQAFAGAARSLAPAVGGRHTPDRSGSGRPGTANVRGSGRRRRSHVPR